MEQPSLFSTVRKFALLAQEAGFSLDTMIQFLDAGVTMETLVRMVAMELQTPMHQQSRWIM